MLDTEDVRIEEERSARKEPLTDKEVRAMLKKAAKVVVAKGKKLTSFGAGEAKPADLKGPSGGYRAPIIVRGKTVLVGFNAEMLRKL